MRTACFWRVTSMHDTLETAALIAFGLGAIWALMLLAALLGVGR